MVLVLNLFTIAKLNTVNIVFLLILSHRGFCDRCVDDSDFNGTHMNSFTLYKFSRQFL